MARNRPSNLWSLWPIILLLFLCAPISALGEKVIIHLKNGDRLTGQIVAESTNEVTVSTTVFGTVKVPAAEISKRETITEAQLAGTNAAPTVAAVAPSTNAPPSEPKVKKTDPVKPANLEAQPIAATPRNWQHQVQFGLNLRYSTKDSQEFLVIGKSTYAKEPFRHIFDANFTYGETEGVTSANRVSGNEKTEYQLSKKAYIFGLIGGGYDEIRKIDAQYELGPGFGYELLNLTNHAFVWKTEVGFNFQQEFLSDDTRQTTYSARIAEIFAWRLFDKLTTDLKVEFFPNVEELGEYRLRLENNWRYPLTDRLSLDLVVVDLYDTLAPAGVERNDLQIRSTLGIKF